MLSEEGYGTHLRLLWLDKHGCHWDSGREGRRWCSGSGSRLEVVKVIVESYCTVE